MTCIMHRLIRRTVRTLCLLWWVYKYRGGSTAIKLDLYLTISETRSSLLVLYILILILLRITVLFSFSFFFLLLLHCSGCKPGNIKVHIHQPLRKMDTWKMQTEDFLSWQLLPENSLMVTFKPWTLFWGLNQCCGPIALHFTSLLKIIYIEPYA